MMRALLVFCFRHTYYSPVRHLPSILVVLVHALLLPIFSMLINRREPSTRKLSALRLFLLSVASMTCMDVVDGLSQDLKTTIPFLSSHASLSRRDACGWMMAVGSVTLVGSPAWGAAAVQDTMSVDSFLRTGVDIGGNMGVSSQAGKTKPVTGVFLRDGSDVSRDPRSGDVLAEIILKDKNGGPMAALTSFSSPWPLATGSFFDIECRNQQGDNAFVAVTTNVNGQSIDTVSDSFLLENLMAPTARFSFYGSPTDVKVKKSTQKDGYRIIDLNFSTLSQSTQTEIPRKARLIATIPAGSSQAVMLVSSALASRWKKGAEESVESTANSFRAVAAPQTSLKLRRKERPQSIDYE